MGTDHVYCKTGFGRSVRETIRNEERHMADPTGSPDGGSEHDPARPAGTPAWVKVFAVIAVVLIAMLACSTTDGVCSTSMSSAESVVCAATPDK